MKNNKPKVIQISSDSIVGKNFLKAIEAQKEFKEKVESGSFSKSKIKKVTCG